MIENTGSTDINNDEAALAVRCRHGLPFLYCTTCRELGFPPPNPQDPAFENAADNLLSHYKRIKH